MGFSIFAAAAGGKQNLSKQLTQLYLRTLFMLLFSPLPPGGPGEGPDCHLPKEMGQIPARIRGGSLFLIFILALIAAGLRAKVSLHLTSLGGGSSRPNGPLLSSVHWWYPLLRNSASGPEIGFPVRISAGF